MKTLASLINLLIPVKSIRKKIRHNLHRKDKISKRRLAILNKFEGYKIENDNGNDIAHIGKYKFVNIFDGDDVNIISEIFLMGEYDFSIGNDVVVIDIGMNIGLASIYFASRNDVVHVYGFEPFRPTYEKALLNIRQNDGLSKKITAYNFGLGMQDDELLLKYDKNAPGMMSTVNMSSQATNISHDLEKVKIVNAAVEIKKIVSLYDQNKIVMKCDTEGAEVDIFKVLDENDLFSKIDVIIMEYHFSTDKHICRILDKNRYAYFKQKSITLHNGDFGMIRAVKL